MRSISASIVVLALLLSSAVPVTAAAQGEKPDADALVEADGGVITREPDASNRDTLAYNAEILDELLTSSAREMIVTQKYVAAAGITGGSILLGLSAWRLFEDPPSSQYSRGLGVMFMTLGMADLTAGVFAATRIVHEQRRKERWERARKNGITEIELARFEGELQASFEARENERLLVRWGSLTHALAGVLVLAFTPIPDSMSRADRVSGYVIGAVFFAVGFATFGVSFRKAPSEKAWENYNRRKTPMPGHEVSWGIAPSISRRGAGLSLGGTF